MKLLNSVFSLYLLCMHVLHRFVIIVNTFFRLADSNFISDLETVKQVSKSHVLNIHFDRGHFYLTGYFVYFDRRAVSDAVKNVFVLSSFG